MPLLIIDTEGSGLFDYKRSADAEGQPRLAQLAMILTDDEGIIESEKNFFIRPDGWSMSPGATEVNGLTDEYLLEHGVSAEVALLAFSTLIMEGRPVVAFNAQHDLKAVRAELRRSGMPDLFEQTRNICVMRKANGIILKEGGKKGWPSLKRCREVLGLSSEGAHGAVKDAMDALAVYRHLIAQGVDMTPEVHHHANVEEIRSAG